MVIELNAMSKSTAKAMIEGGNRFQAKESLTLARNGIAVTPQEGINTAKPSESVASQISPKTGEHPKPVQARPLSISNQIVRALDRAMGVDTIPVPPLLANAHNDLRCPNCHVLHRVGELACGGCGMVFSDAVATHKLDTLSDIKVERIRYVGDAVTNDMRSITFNIDGESVTLPLSTSLVIGRGGYLTDPSHLPPDVDLNRFQAHLNGVSRQHIRITRESDLVHITDLGSLNGTYLNGFRLMPNQERLLRNGDELLLGRLRIRVQF